MILSGRVVERATGLGMAGLQVVATWGGNATTMTRKDGSYSLSVDLAQDGEILTVMAQTLGPGPRPLPGPIEPMTKLYVAVMDSSEKVLGRKTVTVKSSAASLYLDIAIDSAPRSVAGRLVHPTTGQGIEGAHVDILDLGDHYPPRSVTTDAQGGFLTNFPSGPVPPEPAFVVSADGAAVQVPTERVTWDADGRAAVVVRMPWRAVGTVTEAGMPVAGVGVEAWDESWQYPNPLAARTTEADGSFALPIPALLATPPKLSVRVFRDGQQLKAATSELVWDTRARADVRVDVPREASERLFHLVGHVIDRATRRGVDGVRVEAWAGAWDHMAGASDTAGGGRFEVQITSFSPEPPELRFRFYRGPQLIGQPPNVVIAWAEDRSGTTFLEIDAPVEPPQAFRVSGSIIDQVSRTGLSGLRVEAWEVANYDGGRHGAEATTDAVGHFEVVLPGRMADPRRPSPAASLPSFAVPRARTPPVLLGEAPPSAEAGNVRAPGVFFRVYSDGAHLATVEPAIDWAGGLGTTTIELPKPIERAHSTEIGLHELGETVAGTVSRVQTELARYPSTIGAYVLDEIALDIPVLMRVDDLGQLKTRVTDDSTEANAGRVNMKVRPVVGAQEPEPATADQPLSFLIGLTPEAIATLKEQRIFSVEDLARAARTAVGRAVLESYELGVDLSRILDMAALLAMPVLPRPVREALAVTLGFSGPQAFATSTESATIATRLSALLGQAVSQSDVVAWQTRVKDAISIPLPGQSEALTAGTAIHHKWLALGATDGFLGKPLSEEQETSDAVGRFQDFEGGSIYWSPTTGAHEIHHGVRDKWLALGAERSVLRYPLIDELPAEGGRCQHFQEGSIYWSPATGAHEVHHEIRARWHGLGAERGLLGYPVSDEMEAHGGRRQEFQGGWIYWAPAIGAHALHGVIQERWRELGAEQSPLRYPLSDPLEAAGGGRCQIFEEGWIFWSATTGARVVRHEIRAKWQGLASERGLLGYPVTDDMEVAGGVRQEFQRGSIYWSPATGAHEVHDEIGAKWLALGAQSGLLGHCVTDELDADGGRCQHFLEGSIYWSPAAGAHALHGEIRVRWQHLGAETSVLGFPITDVEPAGEGYRQRFQGGSITWSSTTGPVVIVP